MPAGAGGVLAFELADGASARRREMPCGPPLRDQPGGAETLIECRARVEPEGRVPDGLLRLSVGLEDVDDLWADLARAIGGGA
jgi:cystathionine gamma-synthase